MTVTLFLLMLVGLPLVFIYLALEGLKLGEFLGAEVLLHRVRSILLVAFASVPFIYIK